MEPEVTKMFTVFGIASYWDVKLKSLCAMMRGGFGFHLLNGSWHWRGQSYVPSEIGIVLSMNSQCWHDEKIEDESSNWNEDLWTVCFYVLLWSDGYWQPLLCKRTCSTWMLLQHYERITVLWTRFLHLRLVMEKMLILVVFPDVGCRMVMHLIYCLPVN